MALGASKTTKKTEPTAHSTGMKRKPSYQPSANPKLAAGLAALRYGNAAGFHLDRRTRRRRARGQGNRAAISDSGE